MVPTVRLASTTLTFAEQNELFYQSSDLVGFRTCARDLSRQLRRNNAILPGNEEDRCTRGLEQRISVERQKNKFLAKFVILKAQHRGRNSDEVAVLAQRCSTWATHVALLEGTKDYYSAYRPLDDIPIQVTVKLFRLTMRIISKKKCCVTL